MVFGIEVHEEAKITRGGGTFMYKSKQLAESSMTYTVHCVMMLNTFKINSVQTCATFCLLNSLLFSFQFLSNFNTAAAVQTQETIQTFWIVYPKNTKYNTYTQHLQREFASSTSLSMIWAPDLLAVRHLYLSLYHSGT